MSKVTPDDPKFAFLNTCLSSSILRFGTFTLKSGRQSPYFFNAGLFHRADLLRSLATAYASTLSSYRSADISNSPLAFDVLFGPAYKGIPLATATVAKLAELDEERYGKVSFAFNRKEVKDHGEGGRIVGADLKGKKVVIVDDVITAGTAMKEAIETLKSEEAEVVGIVVALDRMERIGGDDIKEENRKSAIGQIREELGIPVLTVLTLNDIVESLENSGSANDLRRLKEYRDRYQAID